MTAAPTLGARPLHVAIDMQRLFIDPPEWRVASLPQILPNVAALCRHRPDRTLLTRFVPPLSAAQEQGSWQRFYRRWPMVTLQHMPPAMIDLVPPLGDFVPPAEIIDKTTYSAFESAAFVAALAQRRPDTLIFSGVETDACVLATALTAIDRGLHVVIVTDAVTSASPGAHAAVLDVVLPRLDQQVELATTAAVIAAWT
jgi:nicotinamidase-related amidase